jgi:hypothetical protein
MSSPNLSKQSDFRETAISIAVEDKVKLDKFKVHRREPYREVIKRILDEMEVARKGTSTVDE